MRAGQHGQALGALASLVVAALWGGGPVCAQPPQEATPMEPADVEVERRVLVVVLPVDPANAATADALTELVIGTVAGSDRATSILGKEEFQAQLGQNDEATLECIGSSTCLGRVGVQLGVAEVLAATLARREGRWIFDLHRIDTRSGESVANAYREVEGELGELADAMIDALGSLDETPTAVATLRVGVDVPGAEVAVDGSVLGTFDGAPLEVAGLAPGAHEVRVHADGHLDWVRTVELEPGDVVRLEAALSPVAPATIPDPPQPDSVEKGVAQRHLSPALWVGLAAVVVGAGTATGFGISANREPEAGVNRAEALAFADDRRRDSRIANAAIGLAVAGLGVMGVGLWRSDFGGASGGSAARVSVTPGGVALDWSTRW